MATKKVKEKKEKPVEPYWQELVHAYSEFCFEKFSERPTFSGSTFRDLKNIIQVLKTRAHKKNIDWTEDEATNRLKGFLTAAYDSSEWLRNNFVLNLIYRHIDSVFYHAAKFRNV